MNPFDHSLLLALNRHAGHTPILDPIFGCIAHYALEVYGVLFLVAWFSLPRREEEQRHALIVAVFGGIIALVASALIGAVWYRQRPFVALPHQVTRLIPHAMDTSFPSDHAAGGFGFVGGMWPRVANWIRWTFLVYSILVMIARVYVGVHWPTDVLGGMVLGLLCGRVARSCQRPLRLVTGILLKVMRLGRFADPLPGLRR